MKNPPVNIDEWIIYKQIQCSKNPCFLYYLARSPKIALTLYALSIVLRNEIANRNKGLIITNVNSQKLRIKEYQEPELQDEAWFRLLQAVERYSPKKGAFSSFAVPYLRGVLQYLRDHPEVTIDRRNYELASRAANVERRLLSANGVKPSLNEIANACGVTVSRLKMAAEEWKLQYHTHLPRDENNREIEIEDQNQNSFSLQEQTNREEKIYEASKAVWRSPYPYDQQHLVIRHCIEGISYKDLAREQRKSPEEIEILVTEVLEFLKNDRDSGNSKRVRLRSTERYRSRICPERNTGNKVKASILRRKHNCNRRKANRDKRGSEARQMVSMA